VARELLRSESPGIGPNPDDGQALQTTSVSEDLSKFPKNVAERRGRDTVSMLEERRRTVTLTDKASVDC
jgi:hypothetical protein